MPIASWRRTGEESGMADISSCVVDTSVIIKALFSPSRRHAGTTYSREMKTHKTCVNLLSVLDERGTEFFLPRCGIIEIAAVSGRLADPHGAEEICNEIESSYTIVPEEQIITTAKIIALSEGCPGFDTYFIALAEQESLPLFTDDLGMHRVCERRNVSSRLVREMDPEIFLS